MPSAIIKTSECCNRAIIRSVSSNNCSISLECIKTKLQSEIISLSNSANRTSKSESVPTHTSIFESSSIDANTSLDFGFDSGENASTSRQVPISHVSDFREEDNASNSTNTKSSKSKSSTIREDKFGLSINNDPTAAYDRFILAKEAD